MGNLTTALRAASSGLAVAQAAISTVSDNVSNVNTAGYSVKSVAQEQRVLSGAGAGVQISAITRSVDQGLLKSIRIENSLFGQLSAQEDYYSRLQDLFGSLGSETSIAHYLSDFEESIELLVASPTDAVAAYDVVANAENLTDKLNSMSASMQELREQADAEISDTVDTINDYLDQIQSLNEQIAVHKATGVDTTGLEDQRDLALDNVSQLIDITYYTRSNGEVSVMTGSGATLVGETAVHLSHSSVSNMQPGTTYDEGEIPGIYLATTPPTDLTDDIAGGALKGLIDIRDSVIPDLQNEIDALATVLADTVNAVHNASISFPGATEMNGTTSFIDTSAQSLTYGGDSDTRLILFDDDGNQVRTTTIRALLGSDTGTIDEIADAINTWLGGDGTASASSGSLNISITGSDRALAIVDEADTDTLGADAEAAMLYFNADGDAATEDSDLGVTGADSVASGFADFFGLNDFFVTGAVPNVYESTVFTGSFSANAATLTFTDTSGTLGTVDIDAGASLTEIAAAVNNADIGITAAVVADGSGYRLQFSNDTGKEMVVTQAAGNDLLNDLGLKVSDNGAADRISVNASLVDTPENIATAQVVWDDSLGTAGQYRVSEGNAAGITALAEALASNQSFETTGKIASTSKTLDQWATLVVSLNSTQAANHESRLATQGAIVDELVYTSDSIRGVNIDEEIAKLMVLQQAYSASGQVIATIQDMMDVLNDMLR